LIPLPASGTERDRSFKSFVESPSRGPEGTAQETYVGNNEQQRVPVNTGVEDSFNRLKVAPPHLLFDSSFQYTLQEKVFIRDIVSGAAVTHDTNRAAARIECSATPGSRARFRSRNYFPYSPSFTNSVTASFNFHGIQPGIVKRIGMNDERNGYILEASGTELKFGIRSSISGAPVVNYVPQSLWNVDKADGFGPSGMNIDPTKQLIFYIQYQWLGSGLVEMGFFYEQARVPCHRFYHSNVLSSLYSQTGTLPIQAEILNQSGAASFFEFTCCSVVSNGATAQHGHLHTASNGLTPKTLNVVGTSYPVLSIRKKPGFSNIPVQVLDMNAFSTSQDDFLVQIIHKPILTGAVWVDIPNSLSQKDVSATSWTGGDVVAEFYMKGNLQASEKLELLARFWDLTLGDDFNGNSEIMSMTAVPLTQNATLYGIISFKEFE
jgi:hypothetical protein